MIAFTYGDFAVVCLIVFAFGTALGMWIAAEVEEK